MISCTPAALLNATACFSCLSEQQLLSINTYLLCQLVNGGGSGGGSQIVVYAVDPNTEGLKPANTALPGVAYSSNGQGATFGWNVTSQTWI